ncbi:MAG: hypothetical protein DMG70_09290 [Acidobacteria bacterium]|nr:MAG: hypothetical protein DMG70_09290 [Acidobacteriota bacterium]PYY05240.1 MAG: hypothetical protein DMG69_27340 [Acidobacteriota bacterium]
MELRHQASPCAKASLIHLFIYGALVGTMRRECLNCVISLNGKHLRRSLREWMTHYNRGRPHASLGPGIQERTKKPPRSAVYGKRQSPEDCRIRTRNIRCGLHHEYWLEKVAALSSG